MRRAPAATAQADGLLLGRVAFGEADLILHLFTDTFGRISALARGARSSKKRFVGALEPMHTLRVEVSDKARGELHTLGDARISEARTLLTTHLDALTTAGKALNWVKKTTPQHTPEPQLWRALNLLLDDLNTKPGQSHPWGLLAGFGLRILEINGWGLNLLGCVSCDKPCPAGRAAWINPERGGLVCRDCGGGPLRLSGDACGAMLDASQNSQVLIPEELTADILRVVDRALGAHMGLDEMNRSDLGRRRK